MEISPSKIRNFCIIAHVDHGKSTLADRLLELTKTVEKRKMQEQVLDSMELERERGITIKLQPVRMVYKIPNPKSQIPNKSQISNDQKLKIENCDLKIADSEYILNLIDTPGHIDFNYEVSRSLAAVEGAILLVDATQGIQAQTLGNLYLALEQNLTIIPVINKIDLPSANIEQVAEDLVKLLGCEKSAILKISAKTGIGVEKVLEEIVKSIPLPKGKTNAPLRALIFDSFYDSYKGVVVYVRVVDGEIKTKDAISLMASGAKGEVIEAGIFIPELKQSNGLSAGEIGWIATGLKELEKCRVGDTITMSNVKCQMSKGEENIESLPGYKEPKPMVYASFYPKDGNDFDVLRDAFKKLKLMDAAFTFEPESSLALGRGFRCGFLGLLHLEIISERLKREFNLSFELTTPSVIYKIKRRGALPTGRQAKFPEELEPIFSANELPDAGAVSEIHEPWAEIEIITPTEHIGKIMALMEKTRGVYRKTDYLNALSAILTYEAPLANVITKLHDSLKSASAGFASMNYAIIGWRKGDLVKLDILVAGDKVDALSRIVPQKSAFAEGRDLVERLTKVIPRQQFDVAVQAAIGGKIIARGTVKQYRKNVTGGLYGGDVTRKMKLLKIQKRGKKKMKDMGKIDIPHEAFIEIMKK
ncbi:translation elongation factor 4 [Patescibacteria group bacterium]|nr:translation elongation factor 4 [Patescibacteria group bacterium]